ncbi:MAG: GlsB/YeaQ/YmgE family stress response membrane protein [Candidatus Acidiferrales bacterium]
MHFIWFLLIGLIAGWLAGAVFRGRGFGVLGNIVVGVLGSLVGGYLFRLVGLSAYGTLGSLLTAFIGAVVLLAIINWIAKK